jgi:hypothetical protein
MHETASTPDSKGSAGDIHKKGKVTWVVWRKAVAKINLRSGNDFACAAARGLLRVKASCLCAIF